LHKIQKMAREYNKKKPVRKVTKGKRKSGEKTSEKKGFNPNADLEGGGESSYHESKRKNLLKQDKNPYERPERKSFDKPYKKRSSEDGGYKRKDDERGGKSFGKKSFDKKPFGRKPFGKRNDEGTESSGYKRKDDDNSERPQRSFDKKPFGRKPFGKRNDEGTESSGYKRRDDDTSERPSRPFARKPFGRKDEEGSENSGYKKRDDDRSERPGRSLDKKPFGKKPFTAGGRDGASREGSGSYGRPYKKTYVKKGPRRDGYKKMGSESDQTGDGLIRLNRYISNAGICSRREADELIRAGAVSVNGKVVTEMGYKVQPTDSINYGGETLRKEKMVYVLLNKPKDFITTLEDPGQRKTVFDLIKNACRERIYPVGRLDRNTTGVLLFTNDGELTKKLTHPKHGVKKIYHVTLDKPFSRPELDELQANGVMLEDGVVKPDHVQYAGEGGNKKEIGIEIHSGRNRVVRRLFEHFGYEVIKLDRVVFAGLTKKDLPRGDWRLLSEKEVAFLKMLG